MSTPITDRFERSCCWIKANWNAYNIDVPHDLLIEWMQSEEPDVPPPAGFHLAVFTFGYMHYRAMESRAKREELKCVPAAQILGLYYQWQVKLALAQVDRRTDIRTSALRLFAFSEDEEVEIRLREDGAFG